MNLYSTRSGYRLFEPRSYPPLVREYRRAEYHFVRKLARRADTLIELGCGKAEHLGFARRAGMNYLGVDPSEEYINQALSLYNDGIDGAFSLHCGGAEDVAEWIKMLPGNAGTLLVFMPFNCLGNVTDPFRVMRALRKVPTIFFFSVFSDSPTATRARLRYYNQSGLYVRQARAKWGVVMQGTGLRSIGFDAQRLQSAAHRSGLKLQISRLGRVGLALWGTNLINRGS
jgi:hypothetical protein